MSIIDNIIGDHHRRSYEQGRAHEHEILTEIFKMACDDARIPGSQRVRMLDYIERTRNSIRARNEIERIDEALTPR